MPVLLVCPLAWVLAFSQDASAQSWTDAYRAGDYVTAADLLHPIVTDFDRQLASPDPGPFRHLAQPRPRGVD